MELKDSIRTIAGIGPKREAVLKENGIETAGDLLAQFPKKYIDRSVMGSLAEPSETDVTIKAVVTHKGAFRRIRRNMSLFTLSVEEETEEGPVKGQITYFNSPWLQKNIEEGCEYYFYGRIVHKNGRKAMYNPRFVKADDPGDFFRLMPEYKAVGNVGGESIHRYIKELFDAGITIPDTMPERIKRKYALPDREEAYRALHLPETASDVEMGKLRLKFEEALKIHLGILSNRSLGSASEIKITHFEGLKRFENSLPFELTQGQIDVLSDIIADLKKGVVMNRLVQGDVGSGKTIVAVACAFLMAVNGYQCAYMAPTEILAEQHFRNFSKFLEPFDIDLTLLTGSMKAAERREALEKIADGRVQVIIGTHALIQKDVDYYNLGMVITDEQHRFGVRQRGLFEMKGRSPHTLVMSATPIPRTLSLVFYGDLDISTIDTLPGGRRTIKTYFYTEKAMRKILGFMAKEMAAGHQAFIVCPFIEESEEMSDVRDAETVYREVDRYYKGMFNVACLHSQMKNDEKKRIISDFNDGKIDLLVATSIIEVGIDVPRVTVMTIMSADRFGLSQLHQLRGRVGRGSLQSYCFLVSNVTTDKVVERMKVIVNNHDGRKIAEEDYRLRGPGDYFGFRQHGFPDMSALDPYQDSGIMAVTKEIAEKLLESPKKEDMIFRTELQAEFDRSVREISMN